MAFYATGPKDIVDHGQNGYLAEPYKAEDFKLPEYEEEELLMNHVPGDHARQAFGRGLAIYNNRYIIAVSSPATVSIYDMNSGQKIKSVNITMDVRNSIHGSELWPFS